MHTQKLDHATILAAIRNAKLSPPSSRPSVLFDAADVPVIRNRAAAQPGMLDKIRTEAEQFLESNADDPNELQAYVGSSEALRMADACLLTDDDRFGRWAQRRIEALMTLKSWMAPVHVGGCRVYDHCMGNITAHVGIAHDHLHHLYSEAQTRALVAGLRRQSLEPFLDGTGDKPEWWARAAHEGNWKIMTCGETGTGYCALAQHFPEAREALARAARGVLETLDAVPAEGDWPEGTGYWFGTLILGLRFARALRRVTGGAVNLFEHPVLGVTGDFAALLVSPPPSSQPALRARVYAFNDNNPTLDGSAALALIMLAAERRRGDWMWVARMFPSADSLYLACNDPAIADAVPDRTVAVFPRTGAVTMRTGWSGDRPQVFIGFKSGPSDVGHSHLDANSFILESHGHPLLIEHPYWPQAHFLGFFDSSNRRWLFDGPGTVGHSTLIVDGKGQTYGTNYPARIVRATQLTQGNHSARIAIGDATLCYPGLLRKFVRSILLIAPDRVVIRDVIEGEGPRHVEWLMHHAGTIRSQGVVSIVENEGVRLTVTPLLPDRSKGWRYTDATRISVYQNSDTLREETRSVRYRAFSTFRPAEQMEFLFALRINGDETGKDWAFEGEAGSWKLRAGDTGVVVRPEGDEMRVE